jgi:LysM repeat protein
LDSGKNSSASSVSSSDKVNAEKPVLVSPAKPVLVSPAKPGPESEGSEDSEKNESEGESPEEEERGLPAEKTGGLEGGEQGSPRSPGAPDSSELERQAGGEAGESSVEMREYAIQPGDSLSRIALKHGLSARVLAEANGITDPNKIRVGQVLKIPEE